MVNKSLLILLIFDIITQKYDLSPLDGPLRGPWATGIYHKKIGIYTLKCGTQCGAMNFEDVSFEDVDKK